MRSRFSVAAGLLALSASTLSAQVGPGGGTADPTCLGAGVAGDACQQAVDFYRYMAPLLGTAMTGGNTTMGQGGTLGGRRFGLVPRFALGIRANAVIGNVPNYSPSLSTVTPNNLTTESAYLPMPAVDLALGVFKGFPLALTNVGGIDLLVSGSYVPEYKSDEISINPESPFAFGFGARVGLLQESLVVPGLGVSYIVRKFPVTTLTASTVTPTPSTLSVNELDVQSNAWRITASKSLVLFGIALGAGQDTYKTSASISTTITGGPPLVTTPVIETNVTRTNYFADVTMNLLLLKIVATGGMVSGGDIVTFNSYDNPADKSRFYGSLGVRFGL